MSAPCPHGPVPDYQFCIPCAMGNGKLIQNKQCMGCLTVVSSMTITGGSPTQHNVTEITERWSSCRKCPKETSYVTTHVRLLDSGKRSVSGSVLHRLAAFFTWGRGDEIENGREA